jgi:hypothetical protein
VHTEAGSHAVAAGEDAHTRPGHVPRHNGADVTAEHVTYAGKSLRDFWARNQSMRLPHAPARQHLKIRAGRCRPILLSTRAGADRQRSRLRRHRHSGMSVAVNDKQLARGVPLDAGRQSNRSASAGWTLSARRTGR